MEIILIYSYHAYDICCINTQVANVVLLNKNAAAPPCREAPANAACMRGYIMKSVYPHLSTLTGYTHILTTNHPGCQAGSHLAQSPRKKGKCPANNAKHHTKTKSVPKQQTSKSCKLMS